MEKRVNETIHRHSSYRSSAAQRLFCRASGSANQAPQANKGFPQPLSLI